MPVKESARSTQVGDTRTSDRQGDGHAQQVREAGEQRGIERVHEARRGLEGGRGQAHDALEGDRQVGAEPPGQLERPRAWFPEMVRGIGTVMIGWANVTAGTAPVRTPRTPAATIARMTPPRSPTSKQEPGRNRSRATDEG